jgi:hypothetical protein
MNCLICRDLEQVFECKRDEYFNARSSAYYRLSTKLAARKNVDMERAKSNLEEHRFVCASAKALPRASSFGQHATAA